MYPAMPFASYTKVTRSDSDAIFAYLRSVPPVHQPNRLNDLRFPFNNRSLILGWRTLFFSGKANIKPRKSDQISPMEPGRLSCAGSRPLRDVPHADQQAWWQFAVAGLRGRPHTGAELERTISHLEQGSRAWRMEH